MATRRVRGKNRWTSVRWCGLSTVGGWPVMAGLVGMMALAGGTRWSGRNQPNGLLASEPRPTAPEASPESARYTVESRRGRVVFLAEALERRFGAKSVAEARDRVLALESPEGTCLPLLEDVRGRAFRNDPRLRELDLELLVRHYAGTPVLQVLGVRSVERDGKYELDYWCDVCAIAMYELKPCECCQGASELRRRKVTEDRRP